MSSITIAILVIAGGVFALHVLIHCYRVLCADMDSNRSADLIWTVLPLLIVAVLFVVALRGEADRHTAPALEAQKQAVPPKIERLSRLHTPAE